MLINMGTVSPARSIWNMSVDYGTGVFKIKQLNELQYCRERGTLRAA
jgi:hypothetical protein